MRRLSAILFMGVLLFNFYGYRLMIGYMQQQQDMLLSAQLEREQYSDADLLSIKTPLPLPYLTSSAEYERVQGSIEIDGITYEYVKRRVFNDTLEILCLPNRAKIHLQSAEREFFRQQLQGTPSGPSKPHTTIKILLPDYCQEIQVFALEGLSFPAGEHFPSPDCFLPGEYPTPDEHPPQSMPLNS